MSFLKSPGAFQTGNAKNIWEKDPGLNWKEGVSLPPAPPPPFPTSSTTFGNSMVLN